MPRPNIVNRPGIYGIQNTVNGKIYIGSATNLSKRWSEHRRSLEQGRHISPHLQYAWDSYGVGAFAWVIVEYCERDDLLEREQHWMDTYQSYKPDYGYNIRTKVSSNLGVHPSDESRQRMSASAKGKPKGLLHRLNISLGKKGHAVNEETRRKISETKAAKYTQGWRPSFVPPPRQLHSDKVACIRTLLSEGRGYREIARMVGTSHATVRRINLGITPYHEE